MSVDDLSFKRGSSDFYFALYDDRCIAFIYDKSNTVIINSEASERLQEFVRSHREEIRQAFRKYLVKEML